MPFPKFQPGQLFAAMTLGASMLLGTHAAHGEEQTRNVALVLDASGSMNGKLPGGLSKMAAAKAAVTKLVGRLPANINLSFRAYGHQSHRRENNCKDTQLLVPFGPAQKVGGQVVSTSNSLKAQGYTPITYVLGLAADDLKPLSGPKTIVLVSDGRETCKGDPCVLARKLAEANAQLTIHTVGLGVDFQTKQQLQCIASVARGKYFDARSAGDLADSMRVATVKKAVVKTETQVVVIKKKKFGHLKLVNGAYHTVFESETGKRVGTLSTGNKHKVKLKPGIYKIDFGKKLFWQSIKVTAGETTTIKAGWLKINNNQYHQIVDPETGQHYTSYSSSAKGIPLPPGRFDVTFGKLRWRNVEMKEGVTTTLNPAVLKIQPNQYHQIFEAGTKGPGITYSSSTKWLAMPPGTYDVTFGKARWKNVVLRAGEERVLKPARLVIAPNQYHAIYEAGGKRPVMFYQSHAKWLAVPPGRYDIGFGKTRWTGIEFTEGEEKRVRPGELVIANNQYHQIFQPGGKKPVASYSTSNKRLVLPPGTYEVGFLKARWPGVVLKEGERTVINPGGFKITPRTYTGIFDAETGKRIGNHSSSAKRTMLPPGKYYVEIEKQKVPLDITEGKIIELKLE